MHLTPKEIDKLMLLSLGMVAERRMKKGLKLNYPEAVAYITSTALEGAREGKTVEEVMKGAASVLKKSDVMEGVADMIDLLQVEAVFTDGSRLVSIHHPIKEPLIIRCYGHILPIGKNHVPPTLGRCGVGRRHSL